MRYGLVQKRPNYLRLRLLRRFGTYFLFVGFGLAFWYFSDSSPLIELVADIKDPSKALSRSGRVSFGDKKAERYVDRVLKGEGLSLALSRNGFSSQEAFIIANLLKKEINLRLIQPGDAFTVERKTGKPLKSDLEVAPVTFSAFELLQTDLAGIPVRYRIEPKSNAAGKTEEDYRLTRLESKVTIQQDTLFGDIESSLYDGILFAGGDAALVNRFSELFGWQLDFYRETQRGDRFKMVVESKYVDGRFIGYGRVKAAEYSSAGKVYRGFYFESEDSQNSGIYDEKGVSLEKTFFKSPLALTRITSRFGQRFHPVLGKLKKHNGVDYGASTGTPFWAVADGVVLEARYSATAGKMIRIRHKSGYVTEYFHASKIAPGIKAGAKVKQKQVIGYVGTTGRSTGPHLHFGMLLNKSYVNPSKQNFAKGNVLPKKELTRYLASIASLITDLERIKHKES